MAETVQFDLCPETGIGCVMIDREAGALKLDLMPDEAAELKQKLASGDMAGAKALLSSVDDKADAVVDDACLVELAEIVH